MSKYSKDSPEYRRWMEGTARANSQGTPQTAEGYESWIYQRYAILYGPEVARRMAADKRAEWESYEKGEHRS